MRTDSNEEEELNRNSKELGQEVKIRKAPGSDASGFLDDDLAEDFIENGAAEAFLNEIGESDEPAPMHQSRPEPAASGSDGISDSDQDGVRRSRKRPEPADGAGKNKSGRRGKRAAIIAGVLALVILVCGGVYAGMGQKYKNVFFPGTVINGIDVSGKTAEEVRRVIASDIDSYVLTIEEREGRSEQIVAKDIQLHSVFDGSLEKIIAVQKPLRWLKYLMIPSAHQIETMIAYDEQAFHNKVDSLECMTQELMIKPVNASLSDYVPGQGYTITPEVMGNVTIPDVVKKGLHSAIMNLDERISLEEIGGYELPALTQESKSFKGLFDTLNRYAGTTITYKFGDKTEVLSGDRTHEWFIINADSTITMDTSRVITYVDELAIVYNTYNKAKTLKTSSGPTITVAGGSYGWKINRAAEADALVEAIKSGVSVEREPIFSQTAAGRSGNDYGDTYVEINLTGQHLYFYKNGRLLVESDFVSGNLSRGWGTPAGTYPLSYKERNATLKGENYRTPVSYWMPFNGGIGMHDASWRSSFGGAIYKTGGSHGCINLPPSVAKEIYENISAGIPVICYNLPGSERGGSPAAKPAETTAPPTEPTETQPPAETAPPEPTQPAGPAFETIAPAGPGAEAAPDSAEGPGAVQ